TQVLRLAIAATVLVALVLAGRRLGALVPTFQAWVEGLGAWGPAAFMAGYALAVVAFAPGSLLTLAGGAILGLVRGTAYVFAAALVGATAAFLIARHAERPWVERCVAADPRFAAIDRAIAALARCIVFLLRLSPVFSFNLLNYAL